LFLLNLRSFFFLSLPFAVSVAGTMQISKQLARKRHGRARLAAYLCLLEGTALMIAAALITYTLRDYTGYIFTSNEDIINRLKVMAPYNAGFQVAYGVYGSAQGILRATSHQLDILG
jgi:Na+-driven multidrug efflux pump